MFYAIARYKIFDVALFEQLLRFGAPLSRSLMQMLEICNDALCRNNRFNYRFGVEEVTKWGALSHDVFEHVHTHAKGLVSRGPVSACQTRLRSLTLLAH